MVNLSLRSAALSLLAVAGMLALACGGASSSPARTATPTARATPSGPTARISPTSGPPGTRVTVSGSGWPANAPIIVFGDVEVGERADPYAELEADADGTFETSFLLERTGAGGELETGRYDLIVRSGATEATFFFLVEVPRPIGGGPGSGG